MRWTMSTSGKKNISALDQAGLVSFKLTSTPTFYFFYFFFPCQRFKHSNISFYSLHSLTLMALSSSFPPPKNPSNFMTGSRKIGIYVCMDRYSLQRNKGSRRRIKAVLISIYHSCCCCCCCWWCCVLLEVLFSSIRFFSGKAQEYQGYLQPWKDFV